MRQLILAALGVFAVAGVASAQQPQPPVPAPPPPPPTTTVIRGNGCAGCGTPATTVRGSFHMAASNGYCGSNCMLGAPCQNGCGSLKSDAAFVFGSCRQFFNPCGPTCGGGLFGGKCPSVPFAGAWSQGWCCPRQYDSYANH